MLKIRRLNMDSSWQIHWAKQSLLIDPWLIGSEIDLMPSFNKQWHRTKPVSIDSISNYDAIVISQHFSDHCHEETLQKLDTKMILTTRKGARRLKKKINLDSPLVIPSLESGNWLHLGALSLCLLPERTKLSASFSGLIIRHSDEIIAYFPHGYVLTEKQKDILISYKTVLLITSFSSFKLPFYLGGYVNPGLENAQTMIDFLNPQYILATHDEDKCSEGIVKKIAKVSYPTETELKELHSVSFINIDLGTTVELKS